MIDVNNRSQVQDLISQGAVFYCSHSGGKDSQAQYTLLQALVPHDQLVVVHADLGAIEWDGVQEHIRATVSHPVNVVRAVFADGSEKTLLEQVRRRYAARPDVPCWPSSSTRFCTSDLKRDPIHKFIRNDLKARGKLIGVNCTGLRAQESPARAKRATLELNKRLSKAGRSVYEWLPIHHLTTIEVFAVIAQAGQLPFHAYQEGNERLSCVFCIFGCQGDLRNGARQRPELLQEYVDLERETGYTFFHKQSLLEKIAGEE
jgi:3'-phosphoadenosine 5'-phosphosulfate sulfotransferase (PAPS reductase)/FAD synthetase